MPPKKGRGAAAAARTARSRAAAAAANSNSNSNSNGSSLNAADSDDEAPAGPPPAEVVPAAATPAAAVSPAAAAAATNSESSNTLSEAPARSKGTRRRAATSRFAAAAARAATLAAEEASAAAVARARNLAAAQQAAYKAQQNAAAAANAAMRAATRGRAEKNKTDRDQFRANLYKRLPAHIKQRAAWRPAGSTSFQSRRASFVPWGKAPKSSRNRLINVAQERVARKNVTRRALASKNSNLSKYRLSDALRKRVFAKVVRDFPSIYAKFRRQELPRQQQEEYMQKLQREFERELTARYPRLDSWTIRELARTDVLRTIQESIAKQHANAAAAQAAAVTAAERQIAAATASRGEEQRRKEHRERFTRFSQMKDMYDAMMAIPASGYVEGTRQIKEGISKEGLAQRKEQMRELVSAFRHYRGEWEKHKKRPNVHAANINARAVEGDEKRVFNMAVQLFKATLSGLLLSATMPDLHEQI